MKSKPHHWPSWNHRGTQLRLWPKSQIFGKSLRKTIKMSAFYRSLRLFKLTKYRKLLASNLVTFICNSSIPKNHQLIPVVPHEAVPEVSKGKVHITQKYSKQTCAYRNWLWLLKSRSFRNIITDCMCRSLASSLVHYQVFKPMSENIASWNLEAFSMLNVPAWRIQEVYERLCFPGWSWIPWPKQINMDLDDGTCCHQRGPPLGRQAGRCKRTRCSCAMSSSVQATLPLDSTRHGSLMHACVATPWTSNWFAVHWQQFKGSGGGTVHADAVGPARVLQPSPQDGWMSPVFWRYESLNQTFICIW